MTSDKLAWQRKYRKENNNFHTKQYEKTKPGFLMRVYRNIQSRVNGIQKLKYHLYNHIDKIPSREEFYEWSNNQSKFHELFLIWEQAGFPRAETPSVDRKNSEKGYEFDNLEWVTHSENSRRGAINRWQKF